MELLKSCNKWYLCNKAITQVLLEVTDEFIVIKNADQQNSCFFTYECKPDCVLLKSEKPELKLSVKLLRYNAKSFWYEEYTDGKLNFMGLLV